MLRVIGCGNTDRADDGAGILVARRLRELGLDALEHAGDGFALLELWHGSDDVVLVDAMSSGALPGTVSVWDASVPASSSSIARGVPFSSSVRPWYVPRPSITMSTFSR